MEHNQQAHDMACEIYEDFYYCMTPGMSEKRKHTAALKAAHKHCDMIIDVSDSLSAELRHQYQCIKTELNHL